MVRTTYAWRVAPFAAVLWAASTWPWPQVSRSWVATFQDFGNALLFVIPLAAACSYLDARRWLRTTVPAARGQPRTSLLVSWVATASFLPFAGAFVAGMLVASGALFAVTGTVGVPWGLLCGALMWLACNQAFATLLGTRAPLVIGLPISLVTGYAAAVFLAARPDTAPALFTFLDDGAIEAAIPPRRAIVWLQTGFFAMTAVTVGSVAAVVLGRRPRAALVGGVSTTLTVAAVLSLLSLGPERRYELVAAAPADHCASRGSLTVCLLPDNHRLSEPALVMLERLHRSAGDAVHLPTVVVDRGIDGPPGSATISLLGSVAGPDLAFALAEGVTRAHPCGRRLASEDPSGEVDRIQWLASVATGQQVPAAGPGPSPVERPSISEQWTWWAEAPACG